MTSTCDQMTNLCGSNTANLAGPVEDILNKAKGVLQTGVDQATGAAKHVVSAAADEVKAKAKEAAVAYALNHPNQVRVSSGGAVLITAGAVAGLFALGYIARKEL